MEKIYQRIEWENYPSVNTALSAINLNKMDYAIDAIDTRVVSIDMSKANQSDLLQTVKSIEFDAVKGIFTFEWHNGTVVKADLNIEKIPVSFEMDEYGFLTMTTQDGTKYTADIASMVNSFEFTNSDTVSVYVHEKEKEHLAYNAQNFYYEFESAYTGKLYIRSAEPITFEISLRSKNGTINQSGAVMGETVINLYDVYEFDITSDGIIRRISIEKGDKTKYSFDVIEGSIKEKHLEPNYLANIKVESEKAVSASQSANESATQASESATRAYDEAERAKLYADTVQEGITTTTDRTLTESHAGGLKINSMDGESQQDGTPTPDTPIDIKSVVVEEIKSVWKNLYDEASLNNGFVSNGITATKNSKGQLNFSGTTTATVNAIMQPFTLPVGTYYMTVNGGTKVTPRLYNRTSATFLTWRSGKFTLTEEAELDIRILIENDVTVSDTVQIQIEEGSTATPYELYQESKVTLSNPITLRGIGDVKDVLCKRDGVYGVERKVGSIVFNGSESWTRNKANNSDRYYYILTLNKGQAIISLDDAPIGYCSHFEKATRRNSYVYATDNRYCVYDTYFTISYNTTTSLEEFKTWLASNNVTIDFKLETPTFEPLPLADQIALHQLETFDTVTYISTDSEIEPIMEVEYGTSKVGGYALKGMNTADANALKIEQLTTLTNDIATQLVAGSEV